jgi:RNA polymerase sigma-70 factor (ECF subfamily)
VTCDQDEISAPPCADACDKEALAAIYDRYQPLIYRYIYRRVGDVEVGLDLTADVFRRLLQAVDRGSGPDRSVRSWLYRTAHNLVVDYYRRQQHRQHLELKEELIAGRDNLERTAAVHLEAERVRRALRDLTPEQEQVLTLKFLEGLSNDEVAEILDRTVGSVKALQHRGLASLRRLLDRDKVEV